MKYYVLSYFFLIVTNCYSQEQTVNSYVNFTSTDFTFTIEKQCTKAMCSVIKIEVKKDDVVVQTCALKENDNNHLQDDMVFILEDMNFDGFIDFRVLQHLPANGNVPYYYWLYNPKTKLFENNTDFEILLSPFFDSKNKKIISTFHFSLGRKNTETYTLKNNKLQLEQRH